MKATGRRRPKDFIRPPSQPPPSVDHHRQFGRESDASFASSRPSSAVDALSDRSYQLSAIGPINSFLASHSSPLSLKLPLPSAKDITEALKFLTSHLDFRAVKLEDVLPILLKHLNCPTKLNKSALKSPGTPYAWPSLLGVTPWLGQIATYNDHLVSTFQCFDSTCEYALNSYLHYIRRDDYGMGTVDREFLGKLERERDAVAESVKALKKEVEERDGKLEELRSGPSAKEVLEKEKGVFEEDVKKFHAIIAEFLGRAASVEKLLEKEKELGVKVQENNIIFRENEELKKWIESQMFNARDAERMKRVLQAVERYIMEAEVARNGWEEKSRDLDLTIGHKFKELEALSIECNQALRRRNSKTTSIDVQQKLRSWWMMLRCKPIMWKLWREVADVLERTNLKLQDAVKQNEGEIRACAWELCALVDSVSKYKEHIASKISETKSCLSETAGAVSDSYKASLPAKFGFAPDASHGL